jgi:hypothetical protein
MSDVFDEIDRQSPLNDPARIAAVISTDERYAYFATSAFAIRLIGFRSTATTPWTYAHISHRFSAGGQTFGL